MRAPPSPREAHMADAEAMVAPELADAARLLAGGRHPDPFSFLGPHFRDGDISLRTFQPGAERVEAIAPSGERLAELSCVDPSGLFEGRFGRSRTPDYRLRITWPGGAVQETEDPYAFPSLLGPLDLPAHDDPRHRIDWVIAGGESGPNARATQPEWLQALRDRCGEIGAAFFFKQWGEWIGVADAPAAVLAARRSPPRRADAALRIGRKAAGRALDGRTHDAVPR